MQGDRDMIQPDQASKDNAYNLDRRSKAEVYATSKAKTVHN